MRKQHAFRPTTMELLEDRTVLSGVDVVLGNLIHSLPAQDALEVARDFTRFEATYAKDVVKILAPAGTTDPSTNRAAFDAAIATALQTLNTDIAKDVADLPSGADLAQTIQAELLTNTTTPTGTSLQEKLAAVASPTTRTVRSLAQFSRSSVNAIAPVESTVADQVTSAPAPTTQVSLSAALQVLKDARAAFDTYLTAYSAATKTLLQGTPTANRATFDTAVNAAVQTLNASIQASLTANLPSSLASSLSTKVSGLLLTDAITPTGKSLQERIAGITTPSGTGFFQRLRFQAASITWNSLAQARVLATITSGIASYNRGA